MSVRSGTFLAWVIDTQVILCYIVTGIDVMYLMCLIEANIIFDLLLLPVLLFSGKILHIDFGDCFEASMNREKFPEKVNMLSLLPGYCGFWLESCM